MKAVICTKYGAPDVLQIKEVKKPAPKDNEVLIRIYATTVSSSDAMIRSSKFPPLLWIPSRLFVGITKPRFIVLDEPVSALDVSIRSQIINLLKKFQTDLKTVLFVYENRVLCFAKTVSKKRKSGTLVQKVH